MASIVATAQDFWRVAEEAERQGIRILVEPFSGDHFATSANDPVRLYRVTGFTCTCKGFFAWQHCPHHALLLKSLGWLSDPAAADDRDRSRRSRPKPAPAPARRRTGHGGSRRPPPDQIRRNGLATVDSRG